MLRKLLPLLLMLALLTCAHAQEPTIHMHDLTVTTLPAPSAAEVPQDFLRLCPEADASTVRCLTQPEAFRYADLFTTQLYAQADGAVWVMHGGAVQMLNEPGTRLTSLCPVAYQISDHWQYSKALIYTVQHSGGTDVRFHVLDAGETTDLLHTAESVVLTPVRRDLLQADRFPLPGYEDLLLCTAQITQDNPSDPALTIKPEKVVGDVAWTGSGYAANIREDGHVRVEYGGERASSLEAFAAAYRELYPSHNLGDPVSSICDLTCLIGDPAYGRLYEIGFNGNVFLWKDGQSHELSSVCGNLFGTGLSEAVLTDLNGDGTGEVVYVCCMGSGIFYHVAAVYDPVARTYSVLHMQSVESAADELHLLAAEGACRLYRGDVLLGTVMADHLDYAGLGLTDILEFLGL